MACSFGRRVGIDGPGGGRVAPLLGRRAGCVGRAAFLLDGPGGGRAALLRDGPGGGRAALLLDGPGRGRTAFLLSGAGGRPRAARLGARLPAEDP